MCKVSVGCTPIKNYKELQNVLKEVSGVDLNRMCMDLKIATGTCNTMESMSVFSLSREFMEQDPDYHCWEFIIQVLCEDFEKFTLASTVQYAYKIPPQVYRKYCK